MNIENVEKNKHLTLQWRNLARKYDEKFKNNGDGFAFLFEWYENVSGKFVTLKMICDIFKSLKNSNLKSFFISLEVCVCY